MTMTNDRVLATYIVETPFAMNHTLETIVGDHASIAAWESIMLDGFERLGEADQ